MLLVEIQNALQEVLNKDQESNSYFSKDYFDQSQDTDIYGAASFGKISKLKEILLRSPQLLETPDDEGMTPLLCAANFEELKTVKVLLNMHANPYVVNYAHQNIVELAKNENKHTETSRYLKKQIGFLAEQLLQFYQDCRSYLKKQIERAKLDNKKIIIFIGETHGDYKNYQLEKQILKAAKDLGITTLFSEQSYDKAAYTSIDLFAQNKLSMKVIGVDNFIDTSDDTSDIHERNKTISTEISGRNENGVMIIGSDHLYGMLEDAETKLDRKKFHVVAFNLSPCVYDDAIECPLSDYSHNAPDILQISDCQFPMNDNKLKYHV